MPPIAEIDASAISLIAGAVVTVISAVTAAVISIVNLVARNSAEARQQTFNLELKRQAELDRLEAEQRNEQVKQVVVDVAAGQDKVAVKKAEEIKIVLHEKETADTARAAVIKEAVDLVNGSASAMKAQVDELKAEVFRLRNAGHE